MYNDAVYRVDYNAKTERRYLSQLRTKYKILA